MSFVLAHRVVGDSAAPRTAYVLHGALGSGQNFSRFVQRLSAERREYAYVLVDLRNHGRSSGAPPPHTLESCAGDLQGLARHLDRPIEVLIGHSFGGKVSIEYARQTEGSTESCLRQVWVLDAVPGSQGEGTDSEVSAVVRAVRGVPMPAQSRQAVVDDLMQRAGLSSGMAQWMATNLKREGSEYHWSFDLDGIEELMADYFRVDLWPYLEGSRQAPRFELVVAERSNRWTSAMRERARALPPESRVTYRLLPDSGHWVHVDNPDALLAMIVDALV